MRKLHPAGADETLVDTGRWIRPGHAAETWTTHLDPDGRRIVRVETTAGDLWHVVLAPDGRPERLEARLVEAGPARDDAAGPPVVDVACTGFDDEVLIWRRGAEPASEAVAVPPGYRLLWPPLAGRAECLAAWLDRTPRQGPDAVMLLSVARRPAARGGLRFRPVKFTLRAEDAPHGARRIHLTTPGLPDAWAEVDAAGRLVRWAEGGAVAERGAAGP